MFEVFRAIVEDIREVLKIPKIAWEMYQKKVEKIKKEQEEIGNLNLSRKEIHYYIRWSEKLPVSKK